MDPRPVVFDISSDEECWGETRRGGDTAGGGGDGYDWISEFFEREPEDSDDVVLVGEVVLNSKPRPKSSSIAERPWVKDLDDDECVILDGDPDKPVVIEKDTAYDSDDLLIVSEKGQIACRDYPHPRHLCAKFPFTSTPHNTHCHLCHCYVCDSLAPCFQWGNATSSVDHCHATDKHEYWKLERRNLKQGNSAPPPDPKLLDKSVPTGLLKTTPVPVPLPPPPPPPSLLQPEYVAHHQVSRPITIRACSTSTNSLIPKGRIHQPPFVNSRNKFLPHLVSQQLPITHNNIIQRDRSHNVSNLGPQFTNSHAVFKRAGSPGVASTTYRSGYTSSSNNHATQYFRNPSPIPASHDKYHSRRPDFSGAPSLATNVHGAPSVQSTDSRFGNSIPSQHRISSPPNRQGMIVNSVPSQPLVSSDLNTGSSYVDTMPYPQASSQPNMESNFDYSVSSQPNMVASSFISPELSQDQLYSEPIPASYDSHNEAQNPPDPIFTDFNTTWVDPSGQSDQQPFADNSHIQSAGVTEFSPQIPVSTNVGSQNFHLYDSWMLENLPVSGALEVPVPSEYVYSPEPAHESEYVYSPEPAHESEYVYSPEPAHVGSDYFFSF